MSGNTGDREWRESGSPVVREREKTGKSARGRDGSRERERECVCV